MDVILVIIRLLRVHLLNWNVLLQKVGFQISCRPMTSQQIKNILTLFNCLSNVREYHPNIYHPCYILTIYSISSTTFCILTSSFYRMNDGFFEPKKKAEKTPPKLHINEGENTSSERSIGYGSWTHTWSIFGVGYHSRGDERRGGQKRDFHPRFPSLFRGLRSFTIEVGFIYHT